VDAAGNQPYPNNIHLATGSPAAGRHFVAHDGRVSAHPDDAQARFVGWLGGRPLGAMAYTDGQAKILVATGTDLTPGIEVISLLNGGDIGSRRAVPLPHGEPWRPRAAALGSERIYLANAEQPYDILSVEYGGGTARRWVRDAPWVRKSLDEFGRQNTMVLAIHDLGAIVLVLTAVRRPGAKGVFAGFAGFVERNVFMLEAVNAATGEVLATTQHSAPPFYGSIDTDIVYRIDEDQARTTRRITFLRVHYQPREGE
jgi:hypothetical protein